MIFKNLDINQLSRLCSQQVDHVTCIECCKHYVVPTTATCGHTLCHSCWRGRRTCPTCSVQVEKKNLKLNLPLQSLKDHVQLLAGAFEELFNIKLDEFSFDPPIEKESEDSNKHVKEWLASSQNHFSAPVTDSQQSIIDQVQSIGQVTSNIQVHSEKKENPKAIGVVHVRPMQVDWDKIEEMPETENTNKNEQNPVGPMDIEPFDFIEYDDKDYSTENPRRSSRNKENKNNHSNKVFNEITSEKNSGKDSNLDSESKSHKLGKNWNSVKRMKKEFSKLNKKNRNKLNVSIEMCKKTQTIANKAVTPNSEHNVLYDIDDNTPQDNLHDKENSKYKNVLEEVTEEISTESNKQKDDDITYRHSNNSKNSNKAQSSVNIKDKPAEDILITNKISKVNINNETLESQKVCFFKKSALNKVETLGEKKIDIVSNENSNAISVNNDDIEITIKIGNTLTNIFIKKKDKDVQFKINSEREIQTSLENVNAYNKNASCSTTTDTKSQNANIIEDMQIDKVHDDALIKCTASNIQIIEKSISIKKNTASAETATGNFEITESVERELTDILDNAQCINEKSNQNIKLTTNNLICDNDGQTTTPKVLPGIPEDMDYLNDLDIFDGESVKEGKVQSLKASKNTPSAILMPTAKSNLMKSLKDERKRELPCSDNNRITKKIKLTQESKNIVDEPMDTLTNEKDKVLDQDSENINYDAIMSQVFANIDADMGSSKSMKTTERKQATQCSTSSHTKIDQPEVVLHKTQDNNDNIHNNNKKDVNTQGGNQKYSENIFSMFEKDISDSEILVSSKTKISTQINHQNEDSTKTAKNEDNLKSFSQTSDLEVVEISTPLDNDDSDKSIVEETPQKSTPLSKIKTKNEITILSNTQQLLLKDNKKPIKQLHKTRSNVNRDPEDLVNVLSLSDTCDTTKTGKNETVVETVQPRPAMETPLTITKFVDQIKHKSTPMARKSLNFNSQNAEDPEQTLCPSSLIAAKTTQEKEFMQRAFDRTQNSPIQSLDTGKNCKRLVKLCVGGSCLSSSEHANLKLLCLRRNWTFVDKYCKELTHLVVGVDEENKSQRSVKYMCALAGAKWIVSYEWVEKCLQANSIVDEEPYEALDGTGEPGPRRSRAARLKLFDGITFYCMPPFTVLDVDTLKDILESAGGRVVHSPQDVRAAADPALLLAEPERTQDDRFMYLAMELSIVPVNYEWVLNCLGSYTLGSIYELLLCPASLLPPVTSNWPSELISRDYE